MWVFLLTPEFLGMVFIMACVTILGFSSGAFDAINSFMNSMVYGFGSLVGILIAVCYAVFLLSPGLAAFFLIRAMREKDGRSLSFAAALFFSLTAALTVGEVQSCLARHQDDLSDRQQLLQQDPDAVRMVDYTGPTIFTGSEHKEYEGVRRRLELDLPYISAGETYTLPSFDKWSVRVYSTREYYLFNKHSKKGIVTIPLAGHRESLLAGGSKGGTFTVPDGDLCVEITRR